MVVAQEFLVKVLRDQLGAYEPHNNGEYSFHCPFCNHYKKKLQINIRTYKWHCWVCQKKGQSFSTLLRKVQTPKEIIQKVAEYTNESFVKSTQKQYTDIVLPKEFKQLYVKSTDPNYKNALHYVTTKRNLSALDILKYNIGYCDSGEYGGMIIVPSYDGDYMLNYFTGRNYYDNTSRKHNNPASSKDVIGFEHLIRWDQPITLVEGAFDAITVKDNVIPLFGKIIGDKLLKAIILNKVKQVNICLDEDAIETAIGVAEYFMNNGVDVKLIELDGKDPNEMGYDRVWTIINNTRILTFSDLLLFKLKL